MKLDKTPGQPTKYKPEFCEMLIDHMKDGLSFECFAAICDVCKKTLFNWLKEYPEFLHSKKRADAHCQLWWEKEGKKGLWNKPNQPTLNTGNWVFQMKNRFHWKDKTELSSDHRNPFNIEFRGYDPSRRIRDQIDKK